MVIFFYLNNAASHQFISYHVGNLETSKTLLKLYSKYRHTIRRIAACCNINIEPTKISPQYL
jgi:hypothetical protein